MDSRTRMARAMSLAEADRVPVMCQLSIGHYFLHSGLDPLDIWHESEAFAEAFERLRRRYGFDGILVNMPGRDPRWRDWVTRIERRERGSVIHWRNGGFTEMPADDCPHYFQPDGSRYFPTFDEVDPERLYYVEPWDMTNITWPFGWGFDEPATPGPDFFPPYHMDAIRAVRARAGEGVSIHGEIFSPWSQFLELFNYQEGLVQVLLDPGKTHACLDRLTEGAIELGRAQAREGVDGVLISSAFAGAGFISRKHYEQFVLPYERRVVAGIKAERELPIYTHTCGKIADRLDLMLATGTNGIDTLDPPPLGTVDLEQAKRELADKAFIKGNIDAVNTLLAGTREAIRADVQYRLEVGKPGGGYILSTACSVAPATPPENIELLVELAEQFGRY